MPATDAPRPAAAAARPLGTVFTRSTGTVHAPRPGDPSRTVCGRSTADMSTVPADAWTRVAITGPSCARCGYPVATAPAAAPITAGTGTDDAPADDAPAYPGGPSRAGRVVPVSHDDTGDVIAEWRGCIVGARFTHRADADAFLRGARTMADRPASCPLPSGGYGACVRQRDHGGRCADAHGHRFTFAPAPTRVIVSRPRTVADARAHVVNRPVSVTVPPRVSHRHVIARVASLRAGGVIDRTTAAVIARTIMADTDTLRHAYRPAVPAPVTTR